MKTRRLAKAAEKTSSRSVSIACWGWAPADSAAAPHSKTRACSTSAGHFAHWPRSALALEGVLNEYFQIPAAVKQFQGEWLYLAVEDRSALPSASDKGQYTRLGSEAVVGQRVWDVESKFRIRLGPLSYAEFRRLLPDGDMLRPVREMVRLYVGLHLEFDVQLVLKRREVPPCRLGGDPAGGARLGWNTWVRHGEFPADVDDAIFTSKV